MRCALDPINMRTVYRKVITDPAQVVSMRDAKRPHVTCAYRLA
jgi:hypothetical protein